MKYIGTVLAVDDIKLSRKFYEDIFGLEVCQDYGINISFTCGLSLQESFDWLVGIPKEKILKQTNNMELYFEAEDLDAFVETLQKRSDITFINEVQEYPWGQRVIRFYDLDKHIIEVGENMLMVIKRFLDSGLTKEQTAERMDLPLEELEKLIAFYK